MKTLSRKLAIDQLDRKLRKTRSLERLITPTRGWIHVIRVSLNMSLRQLGARIGIAPQSVKGFEDREADGSITLKSLREVAQALDMKLVYAFVPVDGTLESMIERQAQRVAESIVQRTAQSMELENQEVSKRRLKEAIREKKEEIVNTMPRYLWD